MALIETVESSSGTRFNSKTVQEIISTAISVLFSVEQFSDRRHYISVYQRD
ncbi:MAG: hypothetical protein LUP95_01870 [Euryarchaeota archaeon]|nr:hypothetical protein [Euryarchaeota archaeon]